MVTVADFTSDLEQIRCVAGFCWIVGIGDLESIHYSRVSSAPMNL